MLILAGWRCVLMIRLGRLCCEQYYYYEVFNAVVDTSEINNIAHFQYMCCLAQSKLDACLLRLTFKEL